MADSSLPIVIGIGAVAGVGFLWWRSRQAAKETKTPTDPCAALAAAGVPPELCRAALPLVDGVVSIVKGAVESVVDAFDDPHYTEWDAKNKTLNGEVEIPLGSIPRSSVAVPTDPNQTRKLNTSLKGTVARFKNGCVPFAGMNGNEKCAPGTTSMIARGAKYRHQVLPHGYEGYAAYERGNGKLPDLDGSHAFTGDQLDPFTTGPWRDGGENLGPEPTKYEWDYAKSWDVFKAVPHFPLTLAPGEVGYTCAGVPMKCPADRPEIESERDSTGRVTCRCVPPAYTKEQTSLLPSWFLEELERGGFNVDYGMKPHDTVDACVTDPAHFIMDHLPDGTPYCRQRSVGE